MILVTGGTGLVGSHLLLKLTQENVQVKAIYRSESRVKRIEALFAFAKAESHFSKINWIQADLTDIPSLEIAFKDVKTVYHCAALISFDPYDFEALIKTNVEGTANVVNLCLTHSVTKLCHLSTIASLGKLPNTPINEDNHWDPNEDNSVYAISKYGAETEVWRASQEGLKVLIFNPGVILGEGPLDEGSGLLFKRIMKNVRYYPIGGTAFIDVKDLIDVMIKGMRSTLYNERYVAISSNHSFQFILEKIAGSLDLKPPKKVLSTRFLKILCFLDLCIGSIKRERKLTRPMIKSLQTTSHFSNIKIKEALSFDPIPIERTIKRISTYYQKTIL